MKIFKLECEKLFVLLRNDMKSLLAGIIAPTVILLIFFLTLGNFVPLDIAFVDEDNTSYSKAFEKMLFEQISPLGNFPYFSENKIDKDNAFALYEKGRVNGVVVIENGFSKQIQAYQDAEISYYFNNYNSDMGKKLRLYFMEGMLSFYNKYLPQTIGEMNVVEEYRVKTQIDWFSIISIGIFLLSFIMGAMFNFLYLFHKEKQYGTLHEYHLSPKEITWSYIARIFVALIAGSITAAINGVLIYFLTGINLLIYILKISPIISCLGITYVCLACIIGLFSKSFNGSAVFSMVLAVIIWFLSGATASSISYATGILKIIAYCIPNSYGLAQMRDDVFNMNMMSGLNNVIGWTIMIGYLLALFALSSFMYRKKLNRSVH